MAKYDKPLAKIKRARNIVDELKSKEASFYADGHYRVVVLDVPHVNVRRFNTKMLDDMGEALDLLRKPYRDARPARVGGFPDHGRT